MLCYAPQKHTREPLIKSTMSRVADKNGMIARRATPVVVIVAPTIRCGGAVWCESGGSGLSRTKGLRPTVSRPLCQGAQHRERPFFVATRKGIGFAGGLLRQAPSEGNNHSRCRLSCIPSRKAEFAAMWDLIRGSLRVILGRDRRAIS